MQGNNKCVMRAAMAGVLLLAGPAVAQSESPPVEQPPAQAPASQPGRLKAPDESGKPDSPAPASRDASGKVEIKVLPEKTLIPNPGDAPVMPKMQFVQGLGYRLPSRWQAEEPSNPMRLAQIKIPAPQGGFGEGHGLLTVTANIGGSVDDNIGRWVAQFTDVAEAPTLQKYKLGILSVHELRVTGTYNAKMPGAGDDKPMADTTLFAAIVEGGPAGPVFFKAVGPKFTMQSRQNAWMMFLRNIGVDVRPETTGAPRAPQDEIEQKRLREQREAQNPPPAPVEKPAEPSKPAEPGKP